MGAEGYIRIGEPKVSEDRIVVFDVAYSGRARKYFSSKRFYLEYGEDIGGLDPSILSVPVVSGVITAAWAVGVDLHVETLDETYLKSLYKMKSLMKPLFSDFSFSTEIDVGDVVSNRFDNDGCGLLFTSGIDSITSYIKHKREKPDLIKIWGAEIPFDDRKNWERTFGIVADFAVREGVWLHVVRTNIPRVLNDRVLYREFGLNWWLDVNYGIVLTNLCAPLTCVTGVGTLYFASGDPLLDLRSKRWNSLYNKIGWANVNVVFDNYEVSRQLKIRYFLRDFVKKYSPVFLKVCNILPASNCGKCEKCLRTITGLVLEGIDPNKCGFNDVDGRTLNFIKESFMKKKLLTRKWIIERRADSRKKISESAFWRDAQKNVPDVLENSLNGSEEFLEWFRTFDISEYMESVQNDVRVPLYQFLYMLVLKISNRMPRSTQNATKRLLDFMVKFWKF